MYMSLKNFSKKYLIAFVLMLATVGQVFSQNLETNGNAKWIWYPGDFEVWLHTQVAGKRQERGQPYPPFWRVDVPYPVIRFEKQYELETPETVKIYADGRYYLRIDGVIQTDFDPQNFTLPAGKHSLLFLIENYKTFPSLLIQGNHVRTDNSWTVTNQDNSYYGAASADFAEPDAPPASFSLEYTPITAKVIQQDKNALLLDFEKETFGKVVVEKLKGQGRLKLFYGESKEEALAKTEAETYDYLDINRQFTTDETTDTRAFRYIYAVWDEGVSFQKISALYEYLPLQQKGTFECSDSLLNRIYDVSLYTLQLTTRELHLDGIKRDRWIWSGDALQSYLMNFYSFFEEGVNTRTLYALRGHDPVKMHINTILDYSFYWMIGIYDHFLYTGDSAFVKQIYPRMKTLMDFCLERTNKNGFVEGLPDDWVFIDWAPIEKDGEISFQQLLLARSLEAMALSAEIANDKVFAERCKKQSETIRQQIVDVFWSDERGAFLHKRKDGVLDNTVTRYANMFSILFDYASNDMIGQIRDNVILNDEILKITTPYMKFYELASLCEIGEQQKAIEFVKDYWGGMLKLGATSVWEAFDPEQSGTEHYAMYGRPFGKSLCHAWGANPIYLFGKYLLGVKPTSPGYNHYVIAPSLAGLDWIKGKVPTPAGTIDIYMDKRAVNVKTIDGNGILRIKSKNKPKVKKGIEVRAMEGGIYEILLNTAGEYEVRYN